MAITDGKAYHTDQVHYLVADITFADSTVSLGWLPKEALVIDASINVTTAFNAGTNDLVSIGFRNAGDGTSDDVDEFATTVDVSAVGRKATDAEINTAGDTYFPDGAEVVASYSQTGTAADAGAGKVWVAYLVLSND